MARQSRWQQFANNFNSVYGTVTNVARDFETARVANQDFEDEEGNPLTGDALQQRRYQGLADVYTKYGDAEGALGLLASQEQLRGARANNEVLAATKDDRIANAGLENDALRARIRASDRSGARRPSDDELFSRAVSGALGQFNVAGSGGSGSEAVGSPPAGFPEGAPRRAVPSGLSAPRTSGELPTVGGPDAPTGPARAAPAAPNAGISPDAAPRRESNALPQTPTISSQGLTPDQRRVQGEAPVARVAGLATANDASPVNDPAAGPEAQTTVPAQPKQPNIRRHAEELQRLSRRKNGKPTTTEARETEVERDRSGDFLLSLAEQFRQMGKPDWVDKTIRLYQQRGEIETARILADTQELQQGMKSALQRGGVAGGIAALDEFNGDTLDVRIVEANGALHVIEYARDGDEYVGQRVIMSAPTEEDLQRELFAYTLNPEASVEYLANAYDAAKAKVERDVARGTAASKVREGAASADKAEADAARAGVDARVANATAPAKVEAAGLANAKVKADIAKVENDIARSQGGLGDREKIATEGLKQLMQSEQYLVALESDPALAADMRANYERAFRMESAPPVGVPALQWYNLTPAEQQEFLRDTTGPRIRN